MPSIGDTEIKQIFTILRRNGQGPDVLRKVGQQYGIAESVVGELGKILTAPATTVQESTAPTMAPTPTTAEQMRQTYLAEKLQAEVTVAEAKTPDQWSIQDIQSQLAGFYPGR